MPVCAQNVYIHHSKQYIHDSILQSDNHVMQTTSSHSHSHTPSGWEAVGGEMGWSGWLTVKNTLQIMHAKNSFQVKWNGNGMVSKWVWPRVRVRAFPLTGIAYCLSAAKWLLLHIHILTRSTTSSICPCSSRIKHRPCTAFVRIVMAISITCTHTIMLTYFNVMLGIFLMNYCTWFDKCQAVSQ